MTGCCQSGPSNSEGQLPPAQPIVVEQGTAATTAAHALPHTSSQAAINQQSSRSLSSGDDDDDSPRPSSHDLPSPHRPPARRPNQLIRPPSPLLVSPVHVSHQPPPWTRLQLERERTAFFDTRVTGQLEVWNALKLVCEMLQHGDVDEAQAVLDAVSVTCPNGRVAFGRGRDGVKGGVYDERGQLYELPAWVVTDPQDMIEAEKADVDGDEAGGEGEQGARERRREANGKAKVADLGEVVRLRARLSDRGTDVLITVGMKERVAMIVRKIQDQIGPRRVRLAYLGHVLQEMKSLESQNYRPGDVLNAYVFDGDEDMLRKDRSR